MKDLDILALPPYIINEVELNFCKNGKLYKVTAYAQDPSETDMYTIKYETDSEPSQSIYVDSSGNTEGEVEDPIMKTVIKILYKNKIIRGF